LTSSTVSFAVFHPNLPIIISSSEDGTIKIWNSGAYRIENTLSYAIERAWCVALHKSANKVAVGYDDSVVVPTLGKDEPTFSMDPTGKLIFTRNQQVLSGNLQTITVDESPSSNGARIPIFLKEIRSSEIFATSLIHSSNGRFVTVVGDGEYITYTALAWRNKSFGNGISFAWAPDSKTYAVLENRVKLRIFKNFKERAGVGMNRELGHGWYLWWDTPWCSRIWSRHVLGLGQWRDCSSD
jgi:coatomer subunit beta'